MLPGRPSAQVSAKQHQDSAQSAYIPLQATEEIISGLLCVANGTSDWQVHRQQVWELQLLGKVNRWYENSIYESINYKSSMEVGEGVS